MKSTVREVDPMVLLPVVLNAVNLMDEPLFRTTPIARQTAPPEPN
jgi:hypothetical protein